MKKFLTFMTCIVWATSNIAQVDLYEIIEDTYGAAWEQKPTHITQKVWQYFMENPDFQRKLQAIRPNTALYRVIQQQVRDAVEMFEAQTSTTTKPQLVQLVQQAPTVAQETAVTLSSLLDFIYGDTWNQKPDFVTQETWKTLSNDKFFQNLLSQNPSPQSDNYQELVERVKKTVEEKEFLFKNSKLRSVIASEASQLYPMEKPFLYALNLYQYQRNFAQELIEQFNRATQDPQLQTVLVQSWIEEQHQEITKRLQKIQGLIDEGNTCYQNALFQVLKYAGHTFPMSSVLLSKSQVKNDKGLLDFLNTMLLPEETFIKISRDFPVLKEQLNKTFKKGEQQDAEELFSILTNYQTFGAQPNQLAPLLSKAFDVIKVFNRKCINCGTQSSEIDHLTKIDLSLALGSDLKELIQESLQSELLFCPTCKAKKYQLKTTIIPNNHYLLVQMPIRYKTIVPIVDGIKIEELAEDVVDDDFPFRIPEILSFSQETDAFIHPAAKTSDWKLIGVIAHYGATLSTGHYISLVNKQGKWFRCDNTEITSTQPFMEESKNINILQKISDEQGSAKPYLLFYERI